MRKLLVASVVSLACGGALADINVFSAALLGANECTSGAPAVCGVGDPDGFGAATVLIDTASNTVTWSFMALSIDPPSAAHIHAGPAGANGPVIIDFSAMAFGTVVDVDAASITPVTAANFYVNVHNPRCPLYFDADSQQWVCNSSCEDHPVWGINWAGAGLICQHMGGRLPFEREWECFASNNDPTKTYPWGNAPPTQLLANFGENVGGTSPVGRYPASELGLYDLAGNLSEWCQDFYTVHGGQSTRFERVVKGGAWSKDAHFLEIATSRGKWERLGTTTIGFRAVWDA